MKRCLAMLWLAGCAASAGEEPAPQVPSPPAGYEVELPEGNYRVTLTFGAAEATETTVRGEARRLFLAQVKTAPGESLTHAFTVHVRRPGISAASRVELTPRERGSRTWDNRLTLEFDGTAPGVRAVDLVPDPDALTVHLAGDSTVTDQPEEPWAAWGQVLPLFFPAGVAVANHAESGLSLRSFRAQGRLEKLLSMLRPGDYVFLQFGHNDMKERGEGTGPFASYRTELKRFVAEIRAKEGRPVLVTPMYRRRFSGNRLVDTLGEYPQAVKLVAREEGVPLIDLHERSGELFRALGPEQTKRAFVHFPAHSFPGQDQPLKDDSHFSTYGAWLLAKCVVEGIRSAVPELAGKLRASLPVFDPSRPDPPESWSLPPSRPAEQLTVPAGN